MDDSEFLPSCWGPRLRGQALVDHFCRETTRLSKQTRSADRRDVRFGDHPRECLDLYLPEGGGGPKATVIFWHGGYWVEGDRQSHAFVSEPFMAAGVAVAVAGYPLAPEASLDEIVASAARCTCHVLGLLPGPLLLSGHSAGAHLATMVAVRLAADEPRIRGLLLMSSVLDVVALLGSSVARDAAISADQAIRNSPLQLVDALPPHLHVVVTFAEHDPPWFARTARALCEALRRRGVASCELLVFEGEDHFSFLLEPLRNGAHPVTKRLVHCAMTASL